MGRLSKFNFPIPGRKNRPAAEPEPGIYAPKAHKILGSTAVNTDSSQWDARSNAAMSIAVSESTASYYYPTTDRAHGLRGEALARARSQWGEESEALPSHLRLGASHPDAGNEGLPDPSDAASLRTRQSNSTILSYYDKSSVPLSISQQTSASAMAKGLPSKATTLLDIDGSMSQPARKSKPAKRDITNIFSRPRTGGSNKSAPGGADYVIDRPPVPTLTHRASHATLTSLRTERDFPRRSTRDKFNELAGRGNSKTPAPEPQARRMSKKEAMHLNNLYDHYEQMSFRQVMGDDDVSPETVDEPTQPPQLPHEDETPDSYQSKDQHKTGNFETPARIPDLEYATSISSRHTRTSKASKKTTPSFIESDLLQQSVLSLSSDSEDDVCMQQQQQQQPKPSPRLMRSQGPVFDEEPVPLSERRRSTASKSSANSGKSGMSGRRGSFASRSTYLTIPPNEPLPPCPPEIARRTSSLAQRSPNAAASSSRRSSRVSVLSTSTTGSASQHYLPDGRMVPRLPNQQVQNGADNRLPETPVVSRRGSARSVERPTPPVSPKSAEPHMRHVEGQDELNPRFMAVSRQEEMLLSALRMKRARMRGNPLAELEEEDYVEASAELGAAANNSPRNPGAYAAPVRAIQKKGSKSSFTTSRSGDVSNHSPSHLMANVATRTATVPIPMAQSPPAAASKKQLSLRCQPERRGRVREGAMLRLDENDAEEPSPDLSDFLDFDNGSEETDGQSSRERDGKGSGIKTPVTPNSAGPSPALGPQGRKIGYEGLRVVTEESTTGVPRPDSPISPQLPLFPAPGGSRKAVRLSAVGGVAGMEASWWGDDG